MNVASHLELSTRTFWDDEWVFDDGFVSGTLLRNDDSE